MLIQDSACYQEAVHFSPMIVEVFIKGGEMRITDLTMVQFDIDGNTHLYKFEETENGVVLQEKIYDYLTAMRNYLYTQEVSGITFSYLWDMEASSESEYTGEEILPFLYMAHPKGFVYPSSIYEIIKAYWEGVDYSLDITEEEIKKIAEEYAYYLYGEGTIRNLCDYICAKYITTLDGDVELHLYRLKEEREPGSLIKEIVIPESEFIRENKRAILKRPLFNVNTSKDGDFWFDNADLVQDTTYSLDVFLTMELDYMDPAFSTFYYLPTYDSLYSSMFGVKRLGINRLCMLDYDSEHIYIYSFIPSKDKIALEKRTINMKQICALIQMLRPSNPDSIAKTKVRYKILKDKQTEFREIIEAKDKICTRQEFIDIIRSNHAKIGPLPYIIDTLVDVLDMYRENRLFSEYINPNIRSVFEESFKHGEYPFYFHVSLESIKDLTFLRYEHVDERLLCYRIRKISNDGTLKIEEMVIPSKACCVVEHELDKMWQHKNIWKTKSCKKETMELDMDEFFTMGFNAIRNETEDGWGDSLDMELFLDIIDEIS